MCCPAFLSAEAGAMNRNSLLTSLLVVLAVVALLWLVGVRFDVNVN
jgi:hypothetical protein